MQNVTAPQIVRRRGIAVCVSFLIIAVIILGIWLFNFILVGQQLQGVLKADPHNEVVGARAHLGYWIDPDTLVFNLTHISETASRMDIFRSFLQYAEAMKGRHFTKVILAAKGKEKFVIDGNYFRQLGEEYHTQNPIYTMRTFPVHLVTLDGGKPFSEYAGGLFAVLGKEMDQFTEFNDQWYVRDFRAVAPSVVSDTAQKSDSNFDPCQGLRDSDPHCGWKPHWDDSGVSTNAIDGTKKEFLSLDSSDADGMDFGKLHYAELKICFENGKFCGGDSVALGVDVHGIVEPLGYETGEEYSTAVRLKFDDEKPVRETWGIADSHDALFPYGHEKRFLSQLLQHEKLILEFSYYEKAARTVTFEISGLAAKMKSQGLQSPTP
jgi:hypothetical protein